MYKRHTGQVSMLEAPEMFGSLPLYAENEWIKLSSIIPWHEFDRKYRENFRSKKGQRAIDSRQALGALLIKERYQLSDAGVVAEIAMNPYLQYFLGLQEYRYEAPFDASMLTRFRQRIRPEMLGWINDVIIERTPIVSEKPSDSDEPEDNNNDDRPSSGGDGDITEEEQLCLDFEEEDPSADEADAVNEGTLILDATCAPQNIRFPTDASLLNEGRIILEGIIDTLHENNLTDNKKPRTYRNKAKNQYNSFSKSRKKTNKLIRKTIRCQLGYIRRDLGHIDEILRKHPEGVETLTHRQQERLAIVRLLYTQQQTMFEDKSHSISDRIVSLSQPWVRPIVRGKQKAPVEFGAKVEMSVVSGYLRIEHLSWDAFNESTTLQESVETYRKAYGHYPERVLADTIFRTRENRRYCKEHGIHMNGPKLGKPAADPVLRKRQKKEEWLESGERGEIERQFGVGKNRYSLGCIVTKLKQTSETAIHIAVLTMNLWKKLRLLSYTLFQCFVFSAAAFPAC